MEIAIVGPSPCPFTIGGIENLFWGLQTEINQNTPHRAELIKLPSRESDFWQLINTYRSFYSLDLSHFDMVISSKYPAWMVQHHNHIVYMAHRLRGLYDTYHFCNLPNDFISDISVVNKVLNFISNPLPPKDIDELFSLLDDLKRNEQALPSEIFNFPGPFIRSIIHFLDDFALQPANIKGYYSISKNVVSRAGYFPSRVKVNVVYPPSFLPHFKDGTSEYIFTISRLDNAKRVSLIVEAMKYVKSDVKLKIAGTGPESENLRKLASGDRRIEFLGFVNDLDVVDLYANSLAVVYVPYDEDYGLVTIEAMMSKKPVITCFDSGGSNEFVTNDETGYSVAPTPEALAEKIDLLFNNKHGAKIMGQRGYELVKGISWHNVVSELLQEKKTTVVETLPKLETKTQKRNKARRKVVVTSTFPIYPPMGGGQLRIYNLYKNIARSFDVDVVSFAGNNEQQFTGEISPNLREIRIPISDKHFQMEANLTQLVNVPITDVAMPELAGYSPNYRLKLGEVMGDASAVVVSHPYLLNEIQANNPGIPLIYEAHNVEYLLKKKVLPENEPGKRILETVYQVEKEASEKSVLILTCSEEDKNTISDLYNVSSEKFLVVPNGVDTETVQFTSLSERQKLKDRLGINGKIVTFIGSWHPPNLEAVEHIFNIAPQLPDVSFFIVGSQCLYFKNRHIPTNVGMFGVVENELKDAIFNVTDIAINPMTSGSGTNLKMLDYMAAGIPVVTTPFGGRGLALENGLNALTVELEGMSSVIRELLDDDNKRDHISLAARKHVEDNFSWEKIGYHAAQYISDIC